MSSFSPSAMPALRQTTPDERHSHATRQTNDPIGALLVVPTLEIGAADAGTVALARILCAAGHRVTVVSRPGRLAADVSGAGAEFIPLDMAEHSPITLLRNAAALVRIARARRCDIIHAHGRAAAWSAYFAARALRVPFLTTWYKGFREQNMLKRLYNSVMVRGTRVVAVSEQIAQLINDRYGTPWQRIVVLPGAVDTARFDPTHVPCERIEAVRQSWGVKPDTKVILVVGRILRRKGHNVVVKAARRLKNIGMKDFLCVFVGEDRGSTGYTGELWDLVLATGTMDVVRMAAPIADMPAAYAAASVVVSAAVQPEGMQRAIVEAQAMARPVIASDLAAGSDVVLTAPVVPEGRVTGLRFPAGDDSALAEALLRLFAMPAPTRRAMGARGQAWITAHFDPLLVAEQTLKLYEDVVGRGGATSGPHR
jgi:glycosyltransferase involved in cell wall biosynthesis